MLERDPAAIKADQEFGKGLPRPGDLIAGKYMVELMIGAGGMGVVYRAKHVDLGQKVAIKLLTPEAAQNAEAVVRFVREARAASSIRSEHVVRIHDVGKTAAGLPFMVMEYLNGTNLQDLVARRGFISLEDTVDWVLQAGEVLAEAHAIGIVHRDLKPSNLFLTNGSDGTSLIKVLDFGISKADWLSFGPTEDFRLTRNAEILGTPTYMSPEQVRAAKDVDTRTDLWSLGVVIFELLTGESPFVGETLPALCAAIASDEPRSLRGFRPEIPHAFEQTVYQCLQKKPEDRLGSIAELAKLIAPFGTDEARASAERIIRISLTELSTMSRRAFSVSNSAAIHDDLVRVDMNPTASENDNHRTRLLGIAGVLTGLLAAIVVIAVMARLLQPSPPPAAVAPIPSPPAASVSSSQSSANVTIEPPKVPSTPSIALSVETPAPAQDAGVVSSKKGAKRRGPLDDRY